MTAPAHWSADVLAATIILESGTSTLDQFAGPEIALLDVKACQNGMHLVAKVASERIRLWCRPAPETSDTNTTLVIPFDKSAWWRSRATERLLALLQGQHSAPRDRHFIPTTYQRRRLVAALAIIDGLRAGLGVRDIAFAVVFPRARPLTGATWKGSSERRHTQRLIRESLRLRDGGYRAFPGFV